MVRPSGIVNLAAFVDEERGLVRMIVETPAGSQNKYDWDEEAGLFVLDRPIHSALRYPFDYGFIPGTLGGDGDPVDAVLFLRQPTFPGCLVVARIVGLIKMRDEGGEDDKILCVADRDPRARGYEDLQDLPAHWLREIEHFFVHIKDLEKERWAEVEGFHDRQHGIESVREGVRRLGSTGVS
jgi:inorganic pyrophosphatase